MMPSMAIVTRTAALFGIVLWALSGVYLFGLLLTGFVDLRGAAIYLSALAVVAGLVLNSLLLRHAGTLSRPATVWLVVSSLCLSAIPASAIVYVALDLGS